MTNLPRRPIEPLAPPPDAFDRVFASARRRRRRQASRPRPRRWWWWLVAAARSRWARRCTRRTASTPRATSKDGNEPDTGPVRRRSAVAEHPTARRRSRRSPAGRQSEPAAGHAGCAAGPSTPAATASPASTYCPGVRTGRPSASTAGRPPAPTPAATTRSPARTRPCCSPPGASTVPYGDTTAGWQLGSDLRREHHRSAGRARAAARPRHRPRSSPGATVTGRDGRRPGTACPGDAYHVWLWLGGNHATPRIRLRRAATAATRSPSRACRPARTRSGCAVRRPAVTVAPGATARGERRLHLRRHDRRAARSRPDPQHAHRPRSRQPREARRAPTPTPAPRLARRQPVVTPATSRSAAT